MERHWETDRNSVQKKQCINKTAVMKTQKFRKSGLESFLERPPKHSSRGIINLFRSIFKLFHEASVSEKRRGLDDYASVSEWLGGVLVVGVSSNLRALLKFEQYTFSDVLVSVK